MCDTVRNNNSSLEIVSKNELRERISHASLLRSTKTPGSDGFEFQFCVSFNDFLLPTPLAFIISLYVPSELKVTGVKSNTIPPCMLGVFSVLEFWDGMHGLVSTGCFSSSKSSSPCIDVYYSYNDFFKTFICCHFSVLFQLFDIFK